MEIITHIKEYWPGYAFLAALPIPLTFMGFVGYQHFYREPKIIRQETTEVSNLTTQARLRSAGEDGFWSYEEQRKFLDERGLKDVVVQQGQEIYFRPKVDIMDGPIPKIRRSGTEVIAGVNLENNGRFLHGSTSTSGTVVGWIDKKDI